MDFDIKTIVFILGVTHLIQILVFYHQYKVNKQYKGLGWWLLWSAAESLGFIFMLLRSIPEIQIYMILFQNIFIVSGTVFIYIGVMRFLGKKENLKIIIPAFIVFFVVHLFFVLIIDNIQIRSINVNTTLALISFLTAYSLFNNNSPSIKATTFFNAFIFIFHGSFFAYRTVMIFLGADVSDFFTPSLFNFLPYLDGLVVGLLWTFGFIIMVNQKLNSDMYEAKTHFEQIFSTSPDAAIITRLSDGMIIHWNEGYSHITGYKAEDMKGKTSLDINLWKNPDDRQEVVNRLLKSGVCNNYEAVFRLKDGSEIIGIMSAKIISLLGVPHIISITRNITEKTRADELIKNSEIKFRSLFENMTEGVALHEILYDNSGNAIDYKIIDVNKAYERHTGLSSINVLGRLASEVYSSFPPPYLKEYSEVVSTGKPYIFETYYSNFKKHYSISIISPAKGQFATVFLDLTEQKNAENELRISEEKFKNFFEQSVVGKSITSIDGKLMTNKSFSEITGYSKEELNKINWRDITHPDDIERDSKIIKSIIDGEKESARWIKRYIHKSGKTVWVDIGTALEKDLNGNPIHFITTINDITERKKAEEEIRKLNAELEQRVIQRTAQLENANKELEAFSYSVSHDLRAPLRSIDGFSLALYEDYYNNFDDTAKDYLKRIRCATQKMDSLIDSLLNLSKVSLFDMVFENVNLTNIAEEISENLKTSDSKRVTEFIIKEGVYAEGNTSLLKIVMENLLNNAWKYTSKKEKTIIEFGTIKEKKNTIYFVRDNGIGFDMKYYKKLFVAFQRLHPEKDYPGTGIGLVTVQRIIKRHNGFISAESELNKGTTFYFTINKI